MIQNLITKYERLLGEAKRQSAIFFDEIWEERVKIYEQFLADLKATSIQTEILGAEVRTESKPKKRYFLVYYEVSNGTGYSSYITHDGEFISKKTVEKDSEGRIMVVTGIQELSEADYLSWVG